MATPSDVCQLKSCVSKLTAVRSKKLCRPTKQALKRGQGATLRLLKKTSRLEGKWSWTIAVPRLHPEMYLDPWQVWHSLTGSLKVATRLPTPAIVFSTLLTQSNSSPPIPMISLLILIAESSSSLSSLKSQPWIHLIEIITHVRATNLQLCRTHVADESWLWATSTQFPDWSQNLKLVLKAEASFLSSTRLSSLPDPKIQLLRRLESLLYPGKKLTASSQSLDWSKQQNLASSRRYNSLDIESRQIYANSLIKCL